MTVPVIDVFAGPGGLGEGFNAFESQNGEYPFKTALSIEMDTLAHRTLRLRSFFRQFRRDCVPDTYYRYIQGQIALEELIASAAVQWQAAEDESWLAELGSRRFPPRLVDSRIRKALGRNFSTWVLLGGPPCQAYSIIGRSKNRSLERYLPSRDKKHELYRSYLRIVARHWPAIFVMENVKGLLSSRVGRRQIFDQVRKDLEDPASVFPSNGGRAYKYRLYPIVDADFEKEGSHAPSDFIVRCESYGIPQARHRIIILGVREDIAPRPSALIGKRQVAVDAVIDGLPVLRSGVSRTTDSNDAWVKALRSSIDAGWLNGNYRESISTALNLYRNVASQIASPPSGRGATYLRTKAEVSVNKKWFIDSRIAGVVNHETRTHMPQDLHRYLYAACFAERNGRSPSLSDFPDSLLPKHKNVHRSLNGDHFADRFRVQVRGRPATTITSHISKDGHYYIHPDPYQCRSMTVREAARIQTFPDNYYFEGGRTAQYKQVGNAVPPILAYQIADIVCDLLLRAGKVR